MAKHIIDSKGFCRAKTREQQKLCKIGALDRFDDHCQYMGENFKCNLAEEWPVDGDYNENTVKPEAAEPARSALSGSLCDFIIHWRLRDEDSYQ
jgi:hypothetical protein